MELLASTGQVKMDRSDLDAMADRGFTVSMHTPYYTNGIEVRGWGEFDVGFYGWLDNLDCYIGDEVVRLTNEEHLADVLAMMDMVVKIQQIRQKLTCGSI